MHFPVVFTTLVCIFSFLKASPLLVLGEAAVPPFTPAWFLPVDWSCGRYSVKSGTPCKGGDVCGTAMGSARRPGPACRPVAGYTEENEAAAPARRFASSSGDTHVWSWARHLEKSAATRGSGSISETPLDKVEQPGRSSRSGTGPGMENDTSLAKKVPTAMAAGDRGQRLRGKGM